jgi:hypothetical protein
VSEDAEPKQAEAAVRAMNSTELKRYARARGLGITHLSSRKKYEVVELVIRLDAPVKRSS